MGLERAVEDGVIEQAVARPGQSLERARLQKNGGGAGADLFRARAHGEGRGHGATAARAAEQIEDDASLEEGLVDADMGGAERAPAAGDEADGVAADEAGEAVVAGAILGDEMVMHRDRPCIQPARVPESGLRAAWMSTSLRADTG